MNHSLSRRAILADTAGLVAVRAARAQSPAPAAQTGTPASTITNPPRDWTLGHPSIYPDPDVLVVDPSFRTVAPGNSAVRRL